VQHGNRNAKSLPAGTARYRSGSRPLRTAQYGTYASDHPLQNVRSLNTIVEAILGAGLLGSH
jgi:hypothetical protein